MMPSSGVPPTAMVVVVPAHDERDDLPNCLANLKVAIEQVAIPVRVAVVLDACTDGSDAILPPWAHAISISARSVGVARAAGFTHMAAHAGADTWLATTDADSLVPPDWLVNQVAHHCAGVEAAVGTVRVEWRHHPPTTQRCYDRLYSITDGATHGHVHGANLGVRADAYWRIGGFRPLCIDEDVDFVRRLRRSGARIAWDARNPVLTSDRRDARATGGFGDYVQALGEVEGAL